MRFNIDLSHPIQPGEQVMTRMTDENQLRNLADWPQK